MQVSFFFSPLLFFCFLILLFSTRESKTPKAHTSVGPRRRMRRRQVWGLECGTGVTRFIFSCVCVSLALLPISRPNYFHQITNHGDVRWRSVLRRKLLCSYNGFSPYGGFWNEVMTGRRRTNGDCCYYEAWPGSKRKRGEERTIISGRAGKYLSTVLFPLSLLYSFAKSTNSRKEAIMYLRTERDERKEAICCRSSDGDGATGEWNVETRGEEGQRWLWGAMKRAWTASLRLETLGVRYERSPSFVYLFSDDAMGRALFYQMITYPRTPVRYPDSAGHWVPRRAMRVTLASGVKRCERFSRCFRVWQSRSFVVGRFNHTRLAYPGKWIPRLPRGYQAGKWVGNGELLIWAW